MKRGCGLESQQHLCVERWRSRRSLFLTDFDRRVGHQQKYALRTSKAHTALERWRAPWVAFYVSADKVHYHDGSSFGTGDTSLFLAYKRHPLIAPSLAGVPLGSADDEPRTWLLVDQVERLLYLAEPEAARRHLSEQWPRYTTAMEYTPEELTRLLADLEETAPPADWAERLAEALREGRANYRLMQQWLDERGTQEQP